MIAKLNGQTEVPWNILLVVHDILWLAEHFSQSAANNFDRSVVNNQSVAIDFAIRDKEGCPDLAEKAQINTLPRTKNQIVDKSLSCIQPFREKKNTPATLLQSVVVLGSTSCFALGFNINFRVI